MWTIDFIEYHRFLKWKRSANKNAGRFPVRVIEWMSVDHKHAFTGYVHRSDRNFSCPSINLFAILLECSNSQEKTNIEKSNLVEVNEITKDLVFEMPRFFRHWSFEFGPPKTFTVYLTILGFLFYTILVLG